MSPHLALNHGLNPYPRRVLSVQRYRFNISRASYIRVSKHTARHYVKVMAGLVRRLDPALRPCHSRSPLLAGDLYLHHLAYLPLQSILHQPDVHDEFHDIVSGIG